MTTKLTILLTGFLLALPVQAAQPRVNGVTVVQAQNGTSTNLTETTTLTVGGVGSSGNSKYYDSLGNVAVEIDSILGTVSLNDTLYANSAVITNYPWMDVQGFGTVDTNGVVDSSAAIIAAIAAAPAKGATILLPAGIIRIDSEIDILDKPLVRLKGAGAEHALYSAVPSMGTVLKWGGATNGVMMKVGATAASSRAVFGNAVEGIAFDCNTLAAYGLQVVSSWHGIYRDLHIHNPKTVGLLTTTIDLTATEDTQGCVFENITVTAVSSFAQNGIGIQCTSGAVGLGNTSLCLFEQIQIYHRDGIGWDFGDSDTNTGEQIGVNRFAGGTGVGVVFEGSGTLNLGHARRNALLMVQPVSGLTAKGTALTQPSGPNYILYDFGNAAPTPTIETGATLWGTSVDGAIPVNNVYSRSRNAAGNGFVDMWRVNSLNEVNTDTVLRFGGNVTIADGKSIIGGSSSGLKVTTASTQKLGFLGATPSAQLASSAANRTALTTFGFIDGTTAIPATSLDALQNNPGSVTLFDEFLANTPGAFGWASTLFAATTGTAAHPGINQAQLGTATNGVASLRNSSISILPGGGRMVFQTSVRVPILSDGTETFTLMAGYQDQATAVGEPVDGIYFLLDGTSGTYTTNIAKWTARTSSNSARTTVSSTITVVAGQWYALNIDINAAASQVDFYVDGVLIGSSNTNIPNVGARETGFNLKAEKQAGTTSRNIDFDYAWWNFTPTVAR